MLTRTLKLSALLVSALVFAACGGGDGGNGSDDTAAPADTASDTAVPDTATPDSATPDTAPADTAVEAETGATPPPTILDATHPGWRKPGCLSCHTYDVHNDGLDPYLCAGCHGTNGAPKPPHEDRQGCACHGQPHGAEGFPVPLSCKACHFPQ